MRFWIGITDYEWFQYLAEICPDEVNFWQPSGQNFRAVKPGAPFLFKLHSPRNFIVGGGFFVRHALFPLSLAWAVFGEKNGAPDFAVFQMQVMKYRSKSAKQDIDPVIGCTVLTAPFFLDESDWIPQPDDWSPNIVQGKTYNTDDTTGFSVWEQIQTRLWQHSEIATESEIDEVWNVVQRERYGKAYPFHPRLGQGAFRVVVTEIYKRRCAVTGERTLPVLEASHIKPYAKSGPHDISNGLLLRSDLHILFDRGYMTITEDFRVEISQRIREEFENGRDYYALHGQRLKALPSRSVERPSSEYIRWHNQNIFRP